MSDSTSPCAPRDGIHVALWIPTDETGRLKRESLAAHLEWLKQRKVHGILGLGSTGEFARMNLAKREEVLSAVVELAAPLPVIANISSINLDEVLTLGRAAKKMGAVGAALMPPPFFPLAQDDILEFFLRAADGVDLPFYLYNYPEVTGNRIGMEVIARFAEQADMIGIKQSGGELAYHKDLVELGREKNYSVFTAADPRLAEFLQMGAAGCLGGLANFLPEYMTGVYENHHSGHSAKGAQMSARLHEIGEILGALPLPLNARSGMEARGHDVGVFKTVISKSTLSIYHDTVQNLRTKMADWDLEPFPKHTLG